MMLEVQREVLVGMRSRRIPVLPLIHLLITGLLPVLGVYSFPAFGLMLNTVVVALALLIVGVGAYREQRMGYAVISMSLGKSPKDMVLAKVLVYGSILMLTCALSVVLN